MFIQRILRNAVLAELLLFLMVANCAPSRPREDAGRVPGNPAASYLPSVVSSSRSKNHNRKPAGIEAAFFFQDPPNEIGFRRVYRWSTGCSVRPGSDLLRFLPSGGVDARGGPNDPDTDIELSSVGPDGKVYILSKTRKLYLCFTKKGKLVTKEKPGGDKTLCQFYDMVWQGNRRFVNVYRRNQQQKKAQLQSVPWPVPVPGFPFGAAISSPAVLSPGDVDDWQVGFSRSGEPLKGSAWRNTKHRHCFDMVEHTEHVRSSDQPSPVGFNQMSSIFQSENSVPRPVAEQSAKPKKASSAGSTKNVSNGQLHAKNAKSKASSSVSKNSLRRDNHKSGSSSSKLVRARPETFEDEISGPPTTAENWKSGLSKRNRLGQKNRQRTKSGTKGRATHSPPETEMPIELWKLVDEEKYNDDSDALTNVDFDSYLAETEELMAHPEEVVASSSEDAVVSTAEYSSPVAASPVHRSAFIHLDSGGWEEVIADQPGASSAVLHQEDED